MGPFHLRRPRAALRLRSPTFDSEPNLGSRRATLRKQKSRPQSAAFPLAASPGLEPRLTESESAVLPLDDEAIIAFNALYLSLFIILVKHFYQKPAIFLYLLPHPLSKPEIHD